jgi:hypothetical protein
LRRLPNSSGYLARVICDVDFPFSRRPGLCSDRLLAIFSQRPSTCSTAARVILHAASARHFIGGDFKKLTGGLYEVPCDDNCPCRHAWLCQRGDALGRELLQRREVLQTGRSLLPKVSRAFS